MKLSIAPFFLFFLLSISTIAQVDRATVNGTVKDATSAFVAGAKVTITAPRALVSVSLSKAQVAYSPSSATTL